MLRCSTSACTRSRSWSCSGPARSRRASGRPDNRRTVQPTPSPLTFQRGKSKGGSTMEYVKVTFPTRRLVYIDEAENGYTNEVLRVEAGTHLFALGNLANYKPESRTVMVKD